MAGCLDNIQINLPDWLELGEKRNAVSSIVAGSLVSNFGERKDMILSISL